MDAYRQMLVDCFVDGALNDRLVFHRALGVCVNVRTKRVTVSGIFMGLQILKLAVVAALFAGGVAYAASKDDDFDELLRMSEQLDELDQQDFEHAITAAENCVFARDFACVARNLTKATKLVSGQAGKDAIQSVNNLVAEERQAMRREEELRVAEARALREEKEAREAEIEQAALDDKCYERCSQPNQLRQCREGRLDYFRCEDDDGGGQDNSIGAGIIAGVNSALQGKAQIDAIHNRAMAAFQAQAEERRRLQAEQRERDRAQREANRRVLLEQRERETAARQQQQQANSDARQREMAQLQERQRRESAEREQKIREQARQQEAAAREEKRVAEAATAKAAREQAAADRQAKLAADKAASADRARAYLQSVASKTKLLARNCYGGTYVVGIRPKVSPEEVACIDVHYRARCAGSDAFTDGVGKNFVGIGTDCFSGDTFEVKPKPACLAQEVDVTVRAVTSCNQPIN